MSLVVPRVTLAIRYRSCGFLFAEILLSIKQITCKETYSNFTARKIFLGEAMGSSHKVTLYVNVSEFLNT